MGRLARQFESFYEDIRQDIFAFCAAMNFEPTWQQADVLELVQAGHKRIAVKSGQGPGKSAISVLIGLWRTIRNFDALTVVTAPTMRQAKKVWLSEARRQLENADPLLQKLIEVTKSKITVGGRPDWGVELITARRAENAQGTHQDNLTIICEESSGIDRDIIEQYEGTITNEDALLLMIGNPNTRDNAFFDCFNRFRHKWATLTLNTEDSTRILVMRNGRPEPMVSPENIAYLAEKYGIDSDVYRIRVKGEFPLMDPRCVISSEDADACTKTDLLTMARIGRGPDDKPARQIGIDFARFGADESMIYRRQGNAIVEWKMFSKVEPADVVRYAFKMQAAAGWRDDECWYVADAGGMGQGVMFMFHEAGKQILEFHNQHAATKQEYDNRCTEAWFHVGEAIKRRRFHMPNDNRLIQQLTTRQYHTTKQGKLILESKEEYKKRDGTDGESPDRADAFVLAAYDAVVAQGRVTTREDGGRRTRIASAGAR